MDVMKQVQAAIEQLVSEIKSNQHDDGSWRYCFESGPMTDAYTIMMLRTLGYNEESLIMQLADRLLRTQHANGSWKLYDDEEGNLSATVEAYTALLFSGYAQSSDAAMKQAEAFILAHGGLEKTHIATKFMLALHGLYPWPAYFPIPLLLLNVPKWLPLSFYKMSSYVKAHFASILILGHKRFTIRNQWTPDLQHLCIKPDMKRNRLFPVFKFPLPKQIFEKGMKQAEQYVLQSIEEDGTISNYASATFFFVYALLSLGYEPASPFIRNAVQGIMSFLYEDHVQNSPSMVWDTALISYALQEAGVPPDDPSIQSASRYLVSLQKTSVPHDHEACPLPGGWSFSQYNMNNPDIDDTQAALRAITSAALHDGAYRKAWNAGVNWLFAMQNKDGGWGSFGKSNPTALHVFSSIQNFTDTALDPSTADVTGRTLEFLGTHVKMNMHHPRIQDAVHWLMRNQEQDGSWYGRWGVSYIYGTWAAVTGMRAVGVPFDHPSIQKAVDWLLQHKQDENGWGESCKSDVERRYIPLPYATLVHTAWALDALISVFDDPTDNIKESMSSMIDWLKTADKRTVYPTGGGLPGHFYIYYHSYPYIWPLAALSHYKNKYETSG